MDFHSTVLDSFRVSRDAKTNVAIFEVSGRAVNEDGETLQYIEFSLREDDPVFSETPVRTETHFVARQLHYALKKFARQ